MLADYQTGGEALAALARVLVPVVARDPLVGRLRGVVAGIGLASPVAAAAAALSSPPPLPAHAFVDLLKHPLCVGEARRVLLAELSGHYGRAFADQWDFAEYAAEQKLDLDLTSPWVAQPRP